MHDSTIAAREDADRRRLARGFAILSGLTFCLIVVGALVRAHDAGLACPDWPLCHGQVVPSFDLKIAFEWGHRAFAGSITIGLVALSWLGLRDPALRGRLRVRLAVAWAVLLTQVVFGGLTVLLLLAPWTVSVHLILGNSFCLILLWIAVDLRAGFGASRPAWVSSPVAPALAAVVATALVLQIALGGWVSSHYAGLACTHFPTCDGQHVVPTWQGLVGIQILHRLNGFVLLGAYALLAWQLRGAGRLGRLSRLGVGLVAAQIAVGAANVLLRLPISVTGLHTAVAAGIVLTTGLLVREVLRSRAAVPDAAAPARVVEAR